MLQRGDDCPDRLAMGTDALWKLSLQPRMLPDSLME